MLAGVVAGVAATKPVVGAVVEAMAVHDGPWRTSPATGRADANPYERAAVAVAGLYALSNREAVYYTAFTDADGRDLDGHCDYVLTGADLPARWWSVTLYGADNYLVDNAPRIYSRHAGNLERDADGGYVVAISATPQPRNWLPAPAEGAFSLTLRLYNPQPSVLDHLATTVLPQLRRGACR